MRHPWTVRAAFNTDEALAGNDPETVFGQFVETGLVLFVTFVTFALETHVLAHTLF